MHLIVDYSILIITKIITFIISYIKYFCSKIINDSVTLTRILLNRDTITKFANNNDGFVNILRNSLGSAINSRSRYIRIQFSWLLRSHAHLWRYILSYVETEYIM